MNSRKKLTIIIAVSMMLGNYQSFAQTAEELFPKAIQLEEVKGELEQAIKMYQTIVTSFPENIPVAAKAYLHMGICYEKLGMQEAQKAFEAVIAKYPTQVDAVRTAREKLDRLNQARSAVQQQGAPGSTIRSIWAWNELTVMGSISPDERYFSLTDWDTGDLVVREIATGKQRRLTNKGVWDEAHPEYALMSRWSPDSRKVAYVWVNAHNESELHEIGLTDPRPRVICGEKKGVWTEPIDWSLDGNFLLAKATIKNGPVELQMISVADGSVRTLKTFSDPNFPPGNAFISPDGLSMAYSCVSPSNPLTYDIFLLTIADGSETALVQHPAHDNMLGWLPGGHGILFASDRTGSTDAWMVPVKAGAPLGSPTLVRRNIGTVQPMGLTQDGKFFFATQGAIRNIYTAAVDPQTGRLISPPVKESLPFEGNNLFPAWSPDGKTLAYVSRRELAKRESVLCLYSTATKEIRELHLNMMFGHPSWNPDGLHLLVQASSKDGQGIYQVDIQSEKITEFLKAEGDKYLYAAQVTPDGKTVVYGQEDNKEKTYRFLVRDIETGQERELARTSFVNSTAALSPDGKHLAMILRPEEKLRVLQVMDFPEGSPKEILRFNFSGDHYIDLAWSPDSRFIYFSQSSDDGVNWDLWRVPGEGGNAQNLGINMRRFEWLSIHPDGRRISFASIPQEGEFPQVWVMENFLPK
jgi:Tol biopolymer transport system component